MLLAGVALGAIARSFLSELGIRLVSHTLSIGPVRAPEDAALPTPDDVDTLLAALRELVPLGVEGAIIGSALYKGTVTLSDALDAAGRP